MSQTKECPNCAMMIDKKSTVCPICKYEFPKQSKLITAVAVFLIVLMLMWMIL